MTRPGSVGENAPPLATIGQVSALASEVGIAVTEHRLGHDQDLSNRQLPRPVRPLLRLSVLSLFWGRSRA